MKKILGLALYFLLFSSMPGYSWCINNVKINGLSIEKIGTDTYLIIATNNTANSVQTSQTPVACASGDNFHDFFIKKTTETKELFALIYMAFTNQSTVLINYNGNSIYPRYSKVPELIEIYVNP
jgi:hypothetical protein